MKKSIFAVVVFLFSSFAMAELADCGKWSSTMDRTSCRLKVSAAVGGRMTEIAGRLYQDRDDLGLSDAERVGVKNYHKQVTQEIIADCGYQNYECQVQHYQVALDQLSTFEAKKKAEKQTRAPTKQASLSSFVGGKAAQPEKVSAEEQALRDRVAKSQKYLNSVKTYNADDEVGD